MQSTQRTAPVTWRMRAVADLGGGGDQAAGDVGGHGDAGIGQRSSSPSTRATSSWAGCIRAQWKGALTGA
jgi:hypothetical protein